MLESLKSFFSKKNANIALDSESESKLSRYQLMATADKKTFADSCEFVAVDFETTGLNFKTDSIISMGFCPLKNDVIRLADCLHLVLKIDQRLMGQNVTIHGLTDDALERGVSQQEALDVFMRYTQGKVIIAHYHGIEERFTQSLALTLLGSKLPLRFVDTFSIAEKQAHRLNKPVQPNALRLFNLRKQMNLPNYKAHNALEDAISTAELFLAQKANINQDLSKIRLSELGFSKC